MKVSSVSTATSRASSSPLEKMVRKVRRGVLRGIHPPGNSCGLLRLGKRLALSLQAVFPVSGRFERGSQGGVEPGLRLG